MVSKDFLVLEELLYCPANSIAPLMEVQPLLLILRCSYFATLPVLRTYSNSYPIHACKLFHLQFKLLGEDRL